MSRAARRIAFVVPYGEASESFFPDTLLGWLSARARRRGHTTEVIRVYYDGRDPSRDEEVRRRLGQALDALAPTDVVVERAFDLAPLLACRARHGSALVMVCRGDGFDPDPRFDAWIGRAPGLHRARTRRTPSIAALVAELDAYLGDEGSADAEVHALPEVELDLAHTVIALEREASLREPRIRTVFGAVGCPHAADPRRDPFYASLPLAPTPERESDALSLLGCSFCPMGGDYQRVPEDALVPWIAAQARAIRAAAPTTEGFVLTDQAPLSYLARLVEETSSLTPVRWLVALRADVFVRERARLERAIATARAHGHRISLYLTGFESFAERELARYLKGITRDELLEAIGAMRALSRAHPDAFEHARDRGHSLILWSPWTSLDDLDESTDAMRAHGLRELFADLGRNRLRLTHELPITRAAERDGAIVESWPDGEEGAARGKGYAGERAWRFLDPGTSLAHQLASMLRERLGRTTELAQLRAATAHARGRGAGDPREELARTSSALDRLEATLSRWLTGARGAGDPARGAFVRAAVLDPGTPCTCGRPFCAERDFFIEPSFAASRLDHLLGSRPTAVVLAGGDVTAHPALEMCLARVREAGVPLGLALPDPRVAGLERATTWLAALSAISLDVTSASDLEAAAALAGPLREVAAREVRVLVSATWLDADETVASRIARLSRSLAPHVLRAVVPLDATPLARLDEVTEAVSTLARSARDAGLAFEVSPLSAGPGWRERMPRAPTPRAVTRS